MGSRFGPDFFPRVSDESDLRPHMKDFQLSINSYGIVRGFIHPNSGIAEVRGIPYATVPERFRSPRLCRSLGGSLHDGSVFGYLILRDREMFWSTTNVLKTEMSPNLSRRRRMGQKCIPSIRKSTTAIYMGWFEVHQSECYVSRVRVKRRYVWHSCHGLYSWYLYLR